MTKKEYRDPEREQRRLATIRRKHGEDFTKKNASKAGKLSTTKFDSDRGSKAANIRWAKERAKKAQKGNTTNGSSN